MSATSEYESTARENYGPATTGENVYDDELDQKLITNMSLSSVRTPLLRPVSLSPGSVETEPDSTNPENIIQSTHNKIEKEVEYHISEKRCDAEMSVDSLSGIVRIEEATIDEMGRIAYPIIQDPEDSNDGNYVESSATLIQTPLNSAIVQNVTKLPQNFTINVDATVGNITAIQNVSQDVSGNQTLWLPTILATSAAPPDGKCEEDRSSGVSQIIITSESYVTDVNQARRSNIASENYISRPKTSKVQILSNISIPKTPSYSPQYITSKDTTSPLYGVHKLNVIPQNQINNSVLCTTPTKSQSLIGSTLSTGVINSSPIKNVSYAHSFSKNTTLNKTLSKVNNGANLNAVVAASSNTQCHILSRVVSGPNKMSVHSGRKSVNTFKGSKNSNQTSGNQKNQSRAIKIIQQTGTGHKSETGKSWPVANVTTYKGQPPIYGVVDANGSKIIQKVGSPTHKSQSVALQKVGRGERLVLQAAGTPAAAACPAPAATAPRQPVRYMHTYTTGDTPLPNLSQVSANQQLTAQILQSLAQPPLVLQPSRGPDAPLQETKSQPNQRRIVFGDKSTLLTADDIIGMEERPNLSEELQRYTVRALAFVMLDHTYALPAQKPAAPAVPPPASPVPAPPPPPASPPRAATPPPPAPPDDAASLASSASPRPAPGGSDTETAPEGEDEGRTRCICDFTHDDGYMICCDRCGEWQHVDCMGVDRQNIPDVYLCGSCAPRPLDRRRARHIQLRKREELSALAASDSDAEPAARRRRLLTVTTYTNNSSGASVTTYNADLPALPAPPAPRRRRPTRPPAPPVKRLVEKRAKRKKELLLGRKTGAPSPRPDAYEPAVTNHYSPELRAKIAKYGTRASAPGAAAAVQAHLCTTVPHAGGKILIATRDLRAHTPVIELRGKYMLASQRPPRAQPFVFHHRLGRDGAAVLVDTRTYGNEARYVRRSCRPNAALQHVVLKGALHVYLCTLAAVPADTEITVPHDLPPRQPCACGNPKHCRAARRARTRPRRLPRTRPRLEPPPAEPRPPSEPEDVAPPSPAAAPPESPPEPELKHDIKPKEEPPELPIKSDVEEDEDEKKPLIEMKIEKIEDPVDEVETPVSDEENNEKPIESSFERAIIKEELPREEEKPSEITAKSACHDRSSRSSRNTCTNIDSLDDKTDDSQDKIQTTKEKDKKKMTREERKMEAIIKAFERMEKAQQRKQEVRQRQKRRESEPRPGGDVEPDHDADHEPGDPAHHHRKRRRRKGRARTTSQSTRRRLNSVDSDLATSNDEAPPQELESSGRSTSGERRLEADSLESYEARTEPSENLPALSAACLLVEAAVGCVEAAFKPPKTKKSMATLWRSPPPSPRSPPASSPPPAVSPPAASPPPVASPPVASPPAASPPAASPPAASPPVSPAPPTPQHSAKKRWLRQAISEETPPESPPREMVTPLKKRRLARESLCCDRLDVPPVEEDASPPTASPRAADTSPDASPRDDLDDLQKKIHSFHTENILMLKSRNRKPNEKRKKVNLNFELSMVDGGISVQLRSEARAGVPAPADIPLPPVESIPLPPEPPRPEPASIPLPAAPPAVPAATVPLPAPRRAPGLFSAARVPPVRPPSVVPVTTASGEPKAAPARRKLSISEYRKRLQGASCDGSEPPTSQQDWAASPPASDAPRTGSEVSAGESGAGWDAAGGVWDAAPTASERQRERLSSRLWQEFGLQLPAEVPASTTREAAVPTERCDR